MQELGAYRPTPAPTTCKDEMPLCDAFHSCKSLNHGKHEFFEDCGKISICLLYEELGKIKKKEDDNKDGQKHEAMTCSQDWLYVCDREVAQALCLEKGPTLG